MIQKINLRLLIGIIIISGNAVIIPINKFFRPILAWHLRKQTNYKNPHKNDSTNKHLRIGSDLCLEEIITIKNRLEIAEKNLQSRFHINKPLNIAICSSGGGTRAMLSTLGVLMGMEQIGLLDCISYSCAISGSTWTQAMWQISGKSFYHLKEQIKENFQFVTLPVSSAVNIPLFNTKEDFKKTMQNLATKILFDQPISIVDVYGSLLINLIFSGIKKNKNSLRLTTAHEKHLKTKHYPFPIYNAISGDLDKYYWYEITPFESGCAELGCWCKTWAFGNKFKNGIQQNFATTTSPLQGKEYAPEQTLAFVLGACSSAFTINAEELIKMFNLDEAKTNSCLDLMVSEAFEKLQESSLGEISIPPASINNFLYKNKNYPISEDKEIELRDAGILFNLPLAPLLRKERKIDLIFILDATSDILNNPAGELIKGFSWCKKQNIEIHNLDLHKNIGTELATILDDNPKCPVMVYLPMIKEPSINYKGAAKDFNPKKCLELECSTFNFKYSAETIDGLIELTKQNIIKCEDIITTSLKIAEKRFYDSNS